MKLLTPDITAALAANSAARRDAIARGAREPDPKPVVRFFSPVGAATWLATEIDADGILFGLADLGFGCPGGSAGVSQDVQQESNPAGRRGSSRAWRAIVSIGLHRGW